MFIQTEPTPNPATLKFIPGQTVLGEGSVDYRDKVEAGGSPSRCGCSMWRALPEFSWGRTLFP